MNPRTGEIYRVSAESQSAIEQLAKEARLVPISKNDAKKLLPQPPSARKNWMRNRACPCGSEKKFKRCCWSNYQ